MHHNHESFIESFNFLQKKSLIINYIEGEARDLILKSKKWNARNPNSSVICFSAWSTCTQVKILFATRGENSRKTIMQYLSELEDFVTKTSWEVSVIPC